MTAPAQVSKRFAEIRAAGELGIVACITEGDTSSAASAITQSYPLAVAAR